MRIIVDQDVSEVMDEIDLYDHSITEVFGEEAVENYIERRYDLVESGDILSDFNDNELEIIAKLAEERGEPITAEEAETLGYSLKMLKDEGIEVVDEDVVEIVESKDQMHLFPELEIGLPPYKVTIKVERWSDMKEIEKMGVRPDGYNATEEEVAQQEEMIERKGLNDVVVAENATTIIKTIEIGYFIEYCNEEYKKYDRENIVFSSCKNVKEHNEGLKFRKGTPYRITKDTRVIEAVYYSDNWSAQPYERKVK